MELLQSCKKKEAVVNRSWWSTIIAIFIFMLIAGCDTSEDSKINIIPKPLELKVLRGAFRIDSTTQVLFSQGDDAAAHVARYLAERIEKAGGLKLKVSSATQATLVPGAILLAADQSAPELGDEGYLLEAKRDGIVLQGRPAGLFYGVQTLFQLLPPQIYGDEARSGVEWTIPAVRIKDKPRFQWRGMHLDVGRHFFPVEFIKKYIDEMAMHKMNVFHWHLTEDQGWRIEIKKYPRLNEIGSWRDGTIVGRMGRPPYKIDNIRYGGYYTQDEIREVVHYAKERFVTVVPEIELPGHSVAALAAYPELSCTGGPFKVRQIWGISDDIYCAGNDQVFEFLEDVLSEVLELFPSEYIHIGGDEAPKIRWQNCPKCQQRIREEGLKDEHELQSYFIRRIEKFLNAKGRRIIGWDEILEGGLAPNAAVMSWRGVEGGIAAARQGHNVVMTPSSHCYFNQYQGDEANEPMAFVGTISLKKVYGYEPIPDELTPEQARNVLGAQGNVWTEYIKTPERVEYQALPRMCALAEVVWSAKAKRDYQDFTRRMSAHYQRLDEMDVNYHWPALTGLEAQNVFIDEMTVNIGNQRRDAEIHYTLDGSEPTKESPVFSTPMTITTPTVIKAREIVPNGRMGQVYEGHFIKQQPLDPVSLQAGRQGLSFQYFKLDEPINATTDLAGLTPTETGRIETIAFPYDDLPEAFGLIFSGTIKVPADGVYAFFVLSNDGSRLFVDSRLIVENDGWHGANEKRGQIALKAGLHSIRTDYIQAGGGKALKVFVKGPGIEKQEIPASMF